MKFVKNRLLQVLAIEFLKTPDNWPDTLSRTIVSLDARWIQKIREQFPSSKSGTTLTICAIEGGKVHAAWTGDSPVWLQLASGSIIKLSNTIHRPSEEVERLRIIKAGGQVRAQDLNTPRTLWCLPRKKRKGPLRCYPGGLTISRSLGDARHKVPELGGAHGVIIAKPDVATAELTEEVHFLVLATDGVTDNLTKGPAQLSKHVRSGFECGYHAIEDGMFRPKQGQREIDYAMDLAAERAVYAAMSKGKTSYQDNTTIVLVGFLDCLGKKFKTSFAHPEQKK